ncbi:hypothetical protein ACTHGU_19470 [Chitinophagaceae bacterium MMS25-I14]
MEACEPKHLKDLMFENYADFRQWFTDEHKNSMKEFNQPLADERLISFLKTTDDLEACFNDLDKNLIDELTSVFIGIYWDWSGNHTLDLIGPLINKWRYSESTKLVIHTGNAEFIKLWSFLINGRSLKDNEAFDSYTNNYYIGFLTRDECFRLQKFIQQYLATMESIKELENTEGLKYVLQAIKKLGDNSYELITGVELE